MKVLLQGPQKATDSINFSYILIAILFLFELIVLYPGAATHYDAINQYQQAKAGFYTSHHPPMMSYIWTISLNLFEGSGGMFVLQLTLYWLAVSIFVKTFYQINKKICSIYIILAFFPSILNYLFVVYKDVHFAFSYLLASSILTYYTVKEKQISLFSIIVILIVLAYGTGVKYQAKFCLPVFTFWCAYLTKMRLCSNYKYNIGILTIIYTITILGINQLLVSKVQNENSYSWQMVKAHDLATISLATGKNYFPRYFNDFPDFNIKNLQSIYQKDLYNPIFDIAPTIRDVKKLTELKNAWWKAVLENPIIYLKQRLFMIKSTLDRQKGYDIKFVNADNFNENNISPFVIYIYSKNNINYYSLINSEGKIESVELEKNPLFQELYDENEQYKKLMIKTSNNYTIDNLKYVFKEYAPNKYWFGDRLWFPISDNKDITKIKNEPNIIVQYIKEYIKFCLYNLALLINFVILIPIYIIFAGLYYIKTKDKLALPLILMNSASVFFILFLTFLSMATDTRYIYFVNVMLLFSSPIGYICLKKYIVLNRKLLH